MHRTALCLSAFTLAWPAAAQSGDALWDVSQEAEAALVLAPGGSSEGGAEREAALFELGVGVSAERTLQSGWTLGGRIVFRAAQDHPARAGATGNLLNAQAQTPAGAYSRLSAGPDARDDGARGSLEAAYMFVETGYGELSMGRDTGIAARFHEGNVSVLSRSRLADPYLDVSGIGAIGTRADITGPSAKISYVTPRLLGVRAGLSYTPRSQTRGLDRDATETTSPARPELRNAVELGVNVSRRLRESGVRLRGGLSYSLAEIEAVPGLGDAYSDRLDVLAAGGEIEWADHYRFGVNWLSADEGLEGGGDYSAWTAGVGYERAGWRGSLTYGAAEIDAVAADSEGVSVALARDFNDAFTIALAWQDRDVSPDRMNLLTPGEQPVRSDGVVIEVTLNFEN